jgi:hypothetical protein
MKGKYMAKIIKTTNRKMVKNIKNSDYIENHLNTANLSKTSIAGQIKKYKYIVIGILVLVVLGMAAMRYKSLFVVAMVDGKPILRSELNSRLMAQYGSQALEGLIGERLIFENGQKQKITVADKEIEDRIVEIEKSLGGMKLDEALKMQGMTRSDFVSRQKIQLTIDKMFSKDISVSAVEVDEYIKNNSMYLTATESAQKAIEAEKAVRNSKIEQKFMEWFNKAKEEAKVNRFL